MSAATQLDTLIHPTPYRRHRFHLLDALRGMGAINVVAFHGAERLHMTPLFFHSALCVDFFFCLSGFVVAFSYERRLQEGLGFRRFLAIRLLRLYPMYWLCMTLVGVIATATSFFAHHSAKRQLLWFAESLVLIPNLAHHLSPLVFPNDNVVWSLFFELTTNILYAAIAVRRKASTTLLGFTAALCFLTLALAVRNGQDLGQAGWLTNTFLMGFPRAGFSFTLGILLLRLYRRLQEGGHSFATLARPAAPALLALFLFVMFSPWHWMRNETFYLAAILLAMPLVVIAGAFARVPRVLESTCSILGNVSYPLYLLHILCFSPLFALSVRVLGNAPSRLPANLLVVTLLSTLLAYLVGRFIESPFRRKWTSIYNRSLVNTVSASAPRSGPVGTHSAQAGRA